MNDSDVGCDPSSRVLSADGHWYNCYTSTRTENRTEKPETDRFGAGSGSRPIRCLCKKYDVWCIAFGWNFAPAGKAPYPNLHIREVIEFLNSATVTTACPYLDRAYYAEVRENFSTIKVETWLYVTMSPVDRADIRNQVRSRYPNVNITDFEFNTFQKTVHSRIPGAHVLKIDKQVLDELAALVIGDDWLDESLKSSRTLSSYAKSQRFSRIILTHNPGNMMKVFFKYVGNTLKNTADRVFPSNMAIQNIFYCSYGVKGVPIVIPPANLSCTNVLRHQSLDGDTFQLKFLHVHYAIDALF